MSAIKLAPRDYNFQSFSQRLRFGALVFCVMFSSWSHAEIWHSTPVSAMRDVAVAPNGIIWLTGKDGAVWVSDNIYGSSFTQIPGHDFIRIAVGLDGTAWVIKSDGTLWKYANTWVQTTASAMQDVVVAPDGNVWLVGENGAIWVSNDQGKQFAQIENNGFSRVSAGMEGTVWAIKSDGTVWKYANAWVQTEARAMQDIAVAPNGLIWLVGKNGAIWSSADDGTTFSQDEHAKDIENIAAGRGGAWAVGSNGTLWRKLSSPQF